LERSRLVHPTTRIAAGPRIGVGPPKKQHEYRHEPSGDNNLLPRSINNNNNKQASNKTFHDNANAKLGFS
jgi:hypothetical protein